MTSPIAPADSTYARIEQKVRRLTASSGELSLKSTDIQQAVNVFYSQDFPYGIKIDQMRSVYTFFTEPNRDRYPLDVNFNQGVRAPMYVEGIQGNFFKDRQQFYALWPRFPTEFKPINGDGTTTTFNFNIQGPFLSKEVVLGGVDKNGSPISVNDDGNGNLQLLTPNAVRSVPLQTTNPALPGMYNNNTGNPGLNNPQNIGTVNYVNGNFSLVFPIAPAAGTQMTLWVSQYQTGRPYSLLFWNNEFTIRPVPKLIHKIEVETFLTPVQFMQQTDTPILNQWWQYIAYGAAMEILRERQDLEGVSNLSEGFQRQEALVLERQAIEELFTPNPTIFNSVTPSAGGVNGIGYYW
jgi:hypothetical protein